MNEHQTLIVLSAFAGLAGAVLTQLLTGMFSYVSDRRKLRHELYQSFCNRKAEIGENFYFMTGERMTLINNTIRYWKNWNDSRSESSLAYLKKEMTVLLEKMEELNAENWKYNLAGLYFKISFTYREVISANTTSHRHYLKVLDISDRSINRPKKAGNHFTAPTPRLFSICVPIMKRFTPAWNRI